MAAVKESGAALVGVSPTKVRQLLWVGLTQAAGAFPHGAWVSIPQYTQKTVSFTGTFGGATINIEGSSLAAPGDGDAGIPLHDVFGVVIAAGAGSFAVIEESPLWIRPVVVGGDGTTSITVTIEAVAEPHP